MKLKVLLAKDTPNELGLPDEWPVICEELPDDAIIEAPALSMSPPELVLRKKKYKPQYDEWKAAHDAEEERLHGWKDKREKAYPKIEEQLDMIYWDEMNGTSLWVDLISKIKREYPKP